MIEVTMCDLTAEQAFDCIRGHADAIVSLTSNPDTGEWVATVDATRPQIAMTRHLLRTDEAIADSIMSQVAALGFVAGHQGQVDPDRYSPENEARRHKEWMDWFHGVSRIGLTCKACGTTYSAEADETDGGVCRQCDEKGLA